MRFRFIATFEPPNTIYRDLFPALAAAGHQVECLISSIEYRDERRPLADAVAGPDVRVTHVPAGVSSRGGQLRALWIDATFALGTMARTLFGGRADVNVFVSQPPLFALWGRVLKLLRRQPYVCLTMDVYPDVALAAGVLNPESYGARLSTRLAEIGWRHADSVIAIGRCMRERFIDHGVPSHQVALIPNWVNDREARPVPRSDNPARRRLGLTDELVVLYSGNLGVSHTFDEIIEAARRLQARDDIRFVFMGEGSRRGEVEAGARDGLDNTTLLPFQPAERLAESLSVGDVHLITLRKGFAGVVVPSKAYGALATGRPLLYVGEAGGEVARLIEDHDLGATVLPGDADGLVAAIERFADDPERRAEQGARSGALAAGECSRATGVQRYISLLERVGAG